MKTGTCLLLLLLVISSCSWWKKKAHLSDFLSQQQISHRLDSLQSQVFFQDSLIWEKEERRSIVWFPDSPHIAVLFREEVSSKAQKGSRKLTQKQSYHEQEQQLQVKEELRTSPPTKNIGLTLLTLLLILILVVLGMSCWRKLTR